METLTGGELGRKREGGEGGEECGDTTGGELGRKREREREREGGECCVSIHSKMSVYIQKSYSYEGCVHV